MLFSRLGFEFGSAGHVFARDACDPESLWIDPFGMRFELVRTSDLVPVRTAGTVAESAGRVDAAAAHGRVSAAGSTKASADGLRQGHRGNWVALARSTDRSVSSMYAAFSSRSASRSSPAR